MPNLVDNAIQGVDIFFRVRAAGSSDTFQEMVCTIDDQIQLTNETTETDTRCGTYVGVKEAKATLSGNAVFNTDTTATEVSYDDVSTFQIAKTLLEFEYGNDAFTDGSGNSIAEGAVLYFTGQGRFTDSTFQGTTGEVGRFSFTFKASTISKTQAS